MLERARLVVANELRAKEGRKAAKAQKGKFWKKKEDDVLQKRKRKKKKGKKDPPPFPVLLCFDSKVPHHAEVQTYDMPDEVHGRPTGAIGLKTCGVYCVADGLGNPLAAKCQYSPPWGIKGTRLGLLKGPRKYKTHSIFLGNPLWR